MTGGLILVLNAGSRQGKCFLHESKYGLWTLEGKFIGPRILVLPQPSLKFSYNLDEVARSKRQNQTKKFTFNSVHCGLLSTFLSDCFIHQLDYSLSALIQT